MSERVCREIVYDRAERMCERCGNVSRGLTCHHRKNRSQQKGGWTPQNIMLLCGSGTTPGGCHHFVTVNPGTAHDEGYNVRSYENEGQVPVLRLGSWVLLDSDGGVKPVDLNVDSSEDSLDGRW